MSVGDTTEDSIIWVPGEATGKDIYGISSSLPSDLLSTVSGTAGLASTAYVDSAVTALTNRLVASGVL